MKRKTTTRVPIIPQDPYLTSGCLAGDGPPLGSAVRVLKAGLETDRALETRRVPNVERVRVDVIVDALNSLDLAIQELTEESFGKFLLGNWVDTHQIPRPFTL